MSSVLPPVSHFPSLTSPISPHSTSPISPHSTSPIFLPSIIFPLCPHFFSHQNGSQLYSVGPLQGDQTLQWLHRRSTESFLTRMEQRKKAWSERILTEEEPPSKQARSTTTTGGYNASTCTARSPLLHVYTCSFAWAMVGWDISPFYFLKASVLCTCISIHVLIISFLSDFLYR